MFFFYFPFLYFYAFIDRTVDWQEKGREWGRHPAKVVGIGILPRNTLSGWLSSVGAQTATPAVWAEDIILIYLTVTMMAKSR